MPSTGFQHNVRGPTQRHGCVDRRLTSRVHMILRPAIPQIALALDASRGVCRSLLQGIASYARVHGPWQFITVEGHLKSALRRLERQGVWAVIAQVDDEAAENAVGGTQLPALTLRAGSIASSLPSRNERRCEI